MQKPLIKQLQNLPSSPGVYQYYDENNKLLYVGKAKNLKKRILSYFQKDFNPNKRNSLRIQNMIAKAYFLQTFIVDSEKDALILENSLIKSQNPKYNILLRDDKTYPYICINLHDSYPRFIIKRDIENKDLLYFGPYPKGAKEILNAIYELFPLIQQASCVKGKKACLYYQLQKCLGVCEFKSEELKARYKEIVDKAITLMKNKNLMQKELKKRMLDFASKELFEQALVCKNSIAVLYEIEHFSTLDLKRFYNADILSLYINGKDGVLLKLFVRDGKVASTHHIFIKHEYLLDTQVEIYTQAILRILQNKTLCKEIIVSNITESNFTLLKQNLAISLKEQNISLIKPKRGAKLELANLANINAKMLLDTKNRDETFNLSDIKDLLLLDRDITHIEIFDTSHHAGSFCVGGMVYYANGEFRKDLYRHYNLEGKDEISQMREMLTRRALKFSELAPPDIWLLDGGKAQINIALEILESSNANVCVVAISKEKRDFKAYRAKGAARDIVRTKDLELRLDSKDKRLQFLQRLRDEVHRFAISFHRTQKTKSVI